MAFLNNLVLKLLLKINNIVLFLLTQYNRAGYTFLTNHFCKQMMGVDL